MAEGQEKTEQPTPRKLQEARKKGQVAKSRDLSSAVVLMAAVGFFYAISQDVVNSLERHLSWYFANCFSFGLPDQNLYWVLVQGIWEMCLIFAPVLLIVVSSAILSNVMQGGFLLAPAAINARMDRINPLEGFKRIFSVNSLFELVKTIFKVIVVGVVIYLVAARYVPQMLMIYFKNPAQEMIEVMTVILVVAAAGGGAYLVLAVGDFYYQRYSFLKNMRMTKQEVKDEYKHTEGDPQIKGWLRRRQREVAMNRIRQEVPRATVVVTNPIHYAVALKYEEGVTAAPVVVAKGAGDIALRLKDIARENSVPVVENPPLARSLFQQVDIGREIPVELYQAVAEVLAMVFRLKKAGVRE
ncbi:MAG: flagellar biosynthesis protein FlhB [Peptococcaceae bacterium]|nr:flagellar biosynthesis protein FlhB [Peptococcaceae bacterium]